MAQKTDKSSAFTVIAAALAVSLVAAAGVLFLQSRSSGAADPAAAALAAVSQAMPLHASAALAGDPAALDRLQADIDSLAGLRRGGSPGGNANWDDLERHARAILSHRIIDRFDIAAPRKN